MCYNISMRPFLFIALIFQLFLSISLIAQENQENDNSGFDAFDSSDFQFAKDCKIESRNSRYKSQDNSSVQHNTKCDHEWALKNSNSLHSVLEIHTNKKLQKLKDPKYSFEDLKEDGLCMESDFSKVECISRVKREALQTKIETRNEIVKNNKQRVELLHDQLTLGGANQDPNPKMSILNDMYRYSQKSEKEKKNKKKIIQNPFVPQIVDFGKPLNPDSIEYKESKSTSINSMHQKGVLGLDPTTNTIETESNADNDKVKNLIIKNLKTSNSGFSQKDYQRDVKDREKLVKEAVKNKKYQTNSGSDNISVQAFRETMHDVNESLGGTLKDQYDHEYELKNSRSPSSSDNSSQYMSTSISINKDSMDKPANKNDYIMDEELLKLMNDPQYPN